jgi:hypothetical protein
VRGALPVRVQFSVKEPSTPVLGFATLGDLIAMKAKALKVQGKTRRQAKMEAVGLKRAPQVTSLPLDISTDVRLQLVLTSANLAEAHLPKRLHLEVIRLE